MQIEQLIEKHKGEKMFFDHELIGAYFTVQNLENLINDVTQSKDVDQSARIAELEEQLRDREQDLAFEHSRAEKLESEKSELLETLKNTIEFCDGSIEADKQYNLIKAIIEKYEVE